MAQTTLPARITTLAAAYDKRCVLRTPVLGPASSAPGTFRQGRLHAIARCPGLGVTIRQELFQDV
jgi:hypothetical protein